MWEWPAERAAMFHPLWLLGPAGALAGLLTAFLFYRQTMREPEGSEALVRIASRVREGASAYLRQQNKVVVSILTAAFVLLLMLYFFGLQEAALPPAFLLGGLLSAGAGYLGMITATNASARTCNAAQARGLNAALRLAFRSGAVLGLSVTGLALFFVTIAFSLMTSGLSGMSLRESTVLMVSFGLGASLQALFARVGGGIFAKAADIGADLVGKTEAGFPKEDSRNPAAIADRIGANVGDVAGMGADLYESYSSSLLAAIALGAAAVASVAPSDTAAQGRASLIPIAIAGLGILASVVAILSVKIREDASPKELIMALERGVHIAALVTSLGSAAICNLLLDGLLLPNKWGWLGLWGCVVLGLIVGLAIGKASEYYTSCHRGPTRWIAEAGDTGSAAVLIEGTAVGMLSTWAPMAAVGVGILGAFCLCGGFANLGLGLFGVSLASVGMLSTLAMTLATNALGPIAYNAGGHAEMASLPLEVRQKTDLLQAAGSTTAAIGKGFATGSAALTALALLAAYGEELKARLIIAATGDTPFLVWGKVTIDEVKARSATYADLLSWYDVTLLNPSVLLGMLAGATLTYIFSALTIRAVGRAATAMIEEVRRQFRDISGLLDGGENPDYAACVAICARSAQSQMVLPCLLVIVAPLAVGLLLGPAAVMGLLTGGLISGFLLAVTMSNAGGAWHSAQKYIESGQHGGKRSPAYQAALVGDMVGKPYKDTAGPALNVLVKLVAIAAVVFAGLTVKVSPLVGKALGFF